MTVRKPLNPALVTTTPASSPAVTLEEAKRQLRVDLDDDDSYIEDILIPAATAHAEAFLNRRLMPQTVELRMDCFPLRGFALGVDPVRSISSVKYYDVDNVDQTLSADVYETDLTEFAAWIQPKADQQWPNVYPRIHAVRIAMEAGFADAESIPKAIKQAILLHVTHLYENREPVMQGSPVDLAYETLLYPHRIVPV